MNIDPDIEYRSNLGLFVKYRPTDEFHVDPFSTVAFSGKHSNLLFSDG